MNLTESIVPRSDQLNADDLIAGPITVTISGVTKGSAEQPVDVQLVEYPGRSQPTPHPLHLPPMMHSSPIGCPRSTQQPPWDNSKPRGKAQPKTV